MKNINTKDQGAVIVEFALVAPIFLLILFAIIEFGNLYQNKQLIALASLEGARMLAKQGSSINQAEKLVIENLTKNGIKKDLIIVSSYDSDPTCRNKDGTVSIDVKVPIKDITITGDPLNLFSNGKNLESKVIMQKECMS